MLLVGDIGGTKTDLAVINTERGPRDRIAEQRFASRDYADLETIAREYLSKVDVPVTHACFAVAGPVVGGRAQLTNLPWEVDAKALRSSLGLEHVSVLNDVHAMASAIPHLAASDVLTLQEGDAVPRGTIALIAPGTGLGQAFLTWDGTRYRSHASEGSHGDFAPTNAQQAALLKFLQRRHARVSYERVCAGRSIPDLYDFLSEEGSIPESPFVRTQLSSAVDRTPPIMAAAFANPEPDRLSLAAVNLFSEILGAQAGNFVLSVFATGGLYVAGGIPQRILPNASGQGRLFLSTFRTKGRLSPLLERLPIYVIPKPVGLLGATVHGLKATRHRGLPG